ncbi:MAG: acyl-CoA dehydrogenase family protein, partial [Candidatus Binataceae bacterium]
MISFELTEEQEMIRETVGAFAREEIRPAARPADEQGLIPPQLIAKSWELGLVRTSIPEALGGDGGQRSAVTGAVIAEEMAYGDLSIAVHALAPRLLAFPILEMGTDEQRKRFLPRMAGREFVATTAAVVEPRFDFDLGALQTVARPENSAFVINGTKCLTPLANEAEAILVYAAAPGPAAGVAGVNAFIVERGAPGLTILEREKNMGIKGLATYGIVLKDLKLRPEARLGGERGCNALRLA